MKLNNKGFAISSVMYIILVMGVILIALTLSIMGSRKLMIDKVKDEALANIYNQLPTLYQQVEYIESTGTEYIDTGVIPRNTVGFKIKMSLPDVSSDVFRFGCKQDTGDTRFVLGHNEGGNLYFGFGSTVVNSYMIRINTPFEASLNYLNSRVADVNGENTVNVFTTLSIEFTYSLIMFGRNSVGNISTSAQKVYSCTITDGDKIIRDFIPCYRKTDGEIGMYDLVNGVFYTNSGTGKFLKGKDV